MNDRGSATVVALALISGLVLVAVGFAAAGRMVSAHAQATAAADAAALAAALTFLPGDPGGEAADYARRNGASLRRCACRKDLRFRVRVVTVEVEKVVDLPVFGRATVRARSAAEFNPWQLLG